MIDHDSLFKKLIKNLFPEFIELFFPDISSVLDKDSITFLPQEILTDTRRSEKKLVDMLVQAKYKNEETLFIIHIEHQSYIPKDLGDRMFCYYADLYKLNGVPILPIIRELDQSQQESIKGFSRERLDDLVVAQLNFTSIEDLEIWLARTELYSTLRDLPRLEKFKTMEFLIAELARDEAPSLQPAYSSGSLFNS